MPLSFVQLPVLRDRVHHLCVLDVLLVSARLSTQATLVLLLREMNMSDSKS